MIARLEMLVASVDPLAPVMLKMVTRLKAEAAANALPATLGLLARLRAVSMTLVQHQTHITRTAHVTPLLAMLIETIIWPMRVDVDA